MSLVSRQSRRDYSENENNTQMKLYMWCFARILCLRRILSKTCSSVLQKPKPALNFMRQRIPAWASSRMTHCDLNTRRDDINFEHCSDCHVDSDLRTQRPNPSAARYLCWWGNQRHSRHPLPKVLQRATGWRCRPNPARTDRFWGHWQIPAPIQRCSSSSSAMLKMRATLECGNDSLK